MISDASTTPCGSATLKTFPRSRSAARECMSENKSTFPTLPSASSTIAMIIRFHSAPLPTTNDGTCPSRPVKAPPFGSCKGGGKVNGTVS